MNESESRAVSALSVRSAVSIVLVLALLVAPLSLGNAATPSDLLAKDWLGQWRGEKALALFELRSSAKGSYEVAIIWVSPEADEAARSMEGQVLAWGLTWDKERGRFIGGTTAVQRDGRTVELPCELLPRKDGTMEFKASYGLLKRTTIWKRP